MGLKDVPALIDYILAKTGQQKLTYIGHSQGTTQLFLGASLEPSYFEERVNLFVALGPVTKLANVNVPAFHKGANEWKQTEWLVEKLHAYNLFNAGWIEESVGQIFCN